MQTPLLKAPIVQANLVSKQVSTNHEHLTILKNVNVDIRKGEKIAIVGTSGAGKSTLMTLLAGLDTPTSGEITLLGHELSKLDDEARAKIRADSLGFVFQSFLLIPSLNALRNVTLPCLLRGEAENDARAKELLTAVGLEQRLTHLPSQLSGGEQQRVALARAFMTQPELLFADEPTGNLDHQTAEKVIELLFDLNEQHGTTLILVTHDSHLASRCDRVYRMEAGELQEETI
ncbi:MULTISPECIES: ABC transporter ATP-binding protein [Vibrio]|jgi:putative ABC transport system ATP-binding protein|uniref:ABC transporter n=1 Tax=Vibrio rotiferianus TaxID=190895 RepID=A0ABX3DEV5_9VIBR|nr:MULTISPECIES: ABC transporter ATP-binding protein [Vibrio]ASI95029.1 ABC transporter [Vibrio rotiferianus]MDK9775822.1 ABC transporter ATP-binding protein [Vibrio sp. D401a]MDK9802899.1 ABC transporter ATP-binding protein [Vibrio sp. D406a]NOH68529.1 ABC transporter ATP-binding protein [Vibrio rotiferianus]OHY96639.1 ABC transporter [Vibrio rotiferianus]